jgi:hypothetical protein
MNTHPAHGCDEHVFRVPPRTRHYPMEPAAPSGRWPRGVHVAKFFGPRLTGRPPGSSLSHRRRQLIRGHARTRRCRRPRPLPRCPVPTNQVTTETPRVELRARRGGGPRGRRDTLVALMLVVGCWCGRGDRPRSLSGATPIARTMIHPMRVHPPTAHPTPQQPHQQIGPGAAVLRWAGNADRLDGDEVARSLTNAGCATCFEITHSLKVLRLRTSRSPDTASGRSRAIPTQAGSPASFVASS